MAGLTEQDRPAQVRRRARRSNRLDISSAQAEISNSELAQSTFPEGIPWRDPAPLYQSLPNEIQELILKAASNPGTPTMRFVSLRQAVIHETDACRRIPPIPGCPCYRHRPNYITFWPLRRQFIMDSAEWRVLCRSTNSRPPRDVIAATNSQGRAVVQQRRRLDPFPQKQGDWSLTKVVLEEAMPAHEIGDPYNCNSGDLILVHILPRGGWKLISGRLIPIVSSPVIRGRRRTSTGIRGRGPCRSANWSCPSFGGGRR
ncbi:hypothetical protein CSUB01_09981 [Colletotrichum sublineola]|uniref:Uncharacterized protein n=1 Tax=Colletotrichum sublineola TaxID=1173701 RepID=A0A066XIY7_COLSU|nr:hypothetical protein CSUB01_09981 [Colletotrichum sublineola]